MKLPGVAAFAVLVLLFASAGAEKSSKVRQKKKAAQKSTIIAGKEPIITTDPPTGSTSTTITGTVSGDTSELGTTYPLMAAKRAMRFQPSPKWKLHLSELIFDTNNGRPRLVAVGCPPPEIKPISATGGKSVFSYKFTPSAPPSSGRHIFVVTGRLIPSGKPFYPSAYAQE